jgi:hypothetical protein
LNSITLEISPGELIDRTTILRIKHQCITDPPKRKSVRAELIRHEALVSSLPSRETLQPLIDRLLLINAQLWEIEDDLRIFECKQDFGMEFITLARAVYRTNDRRAATKREIDQLLGSAISEVKSYGDRK